MDFFSKITFKKAIKLIGKLWSGKIGWVVILSNNSIVFESDLYIKGELSPWQKLLKYMKKNNLYIIGVIIHVNGRIFEIPEKHESKQIWVFRRSELIVQGFYQKQNDFIGLSWVNQGRRYIVWVNEKTTKDNEQIISLDDKLNALPEKYYGGK